MRYMWDRFDDYFSFKKNGIITTVAAYLVRPFLKWWDYQVSQSHNVDLIITNSHFISKKVKQHYGRDSKVINPFVDYETFYPKKSIQKKNYFLAFGAFAPYKRFDLVIDVFLRLKNLNLIIAGSGQDELFIKQKITSASNIKLMIHPKDDDLPSLYQEARAFLFPGLEDFGITPLESLAANTPVIAYAHGGVLDSVTKETGIFFNEQTPESLEKALLEFIEKETFFSLDQCSERASHFTKQQFKTSFQKIAQSFSL